MPLDMNPEIRAQWAGALRSGEYQQARGTLRRGDSYCCLGVLCDLAVKARVLGEPSLLPEGGRWSFGGATDLLPRVVAEWADIGELNPGVVGGAGEMVALAEENDDGRPFAEIADLIDGGVS